MVWLYSLLFDKHLPLSLLAKIALPAGLESSAITKLEVNQPHPNDKRTIHYFPCTIYIAGLITCLQYLLVCITWLLFLLL